MVSKVSRTIRLEENLSEAFKRSSKESNKIYSERFPSLQVEKR